MKNRFVRLVLGLSLVATPALAQYSIDWYKIAGGGGTSTGGVYSLSGTIGQADAGAMSGGNYSLIGGFWSIVAAVPTAGSPLLTITRTLTNTVVVSWPSPSTGFVLQQNSDLTTPSWANAPQNPVDNGTTKSIVVNPPVGSLFYRLIK